MLGKSFQSIYQLSLQLKLAIYNDHFQKVARHSSLSSFLWKITLHGNPSMVPCSHVVLKSTTIKFFLLLTTFHSKVFPDSTPSTEIKTTHMHRHLKYNSLNWMEKQCKEMNEKMAASSDAIVSNLPWQMSHWGNLAPEKAAATSTNLSTLLAPLWFSLFMIELHHNAGNIISTAPSKRSFGQLPSSRFWFFFCLCQWNSILEEDNSSN